jgi:hypothetical protein
VKKRRTLAAAFCALALLAGARPAEAAAPIVLHYGCNDVAAVARIRTLGYLEEASILEIILGRRLFGMRLEIKRLLRGAEPRRIVTAHQLIKTQWPNDRDFLVVLTHDGEEYRLSEATPWDRIPRPVLADRCN